MNKKIQPTRADFSVNTKELDYESITKNEQKTRKKSQVSYDISSDKTRRRKIAGCVAATKAAK